MVGYYYDANHIRAILIKNRRGLTITEVWEELYKIFAKVGISPNTYVLDNKVLKDLLETFKRYNINH